MGCMYMWGIYMVILGDGVLCVVMHSCVSEWVGRMIALRQ